MSTRVRRKGPVTTVREPLSPRRKWQTITIATLMLVPAYWALMAGIVSAASGDKAAGPTPGSGLALGLVMIPFVFIVLAVMSDHPRWPTAVLKAMGLAIVVGIPVSALAADAVTGIVAGVGAGGIAALRSDPSEGHSWKARALAVVVAAAYTLVLVRVASVLALLPAPIFPFTAIGVADHLAERRQRRGATAGPRAADQT